jgi:hypothetical protein
MENENVGSGSLETRVDSTGTMPPFPEGPEVSSMSASDAQKEWRDMTVGDEKFKDFPRSVLLKRRDQLFARGFGEKIAEQKKIQEVEGAKFLKEENEKIAERNERESLGKARDINIHFFGSEKKADEMVERAAETISKLSKENREFLYEYIPNSEDFAWGDLPEVIGFLANLSSSPDLIKRVEQNGLKHYIEIYSKLPRRATK